MPPEKIRPRSPRIVLSDAVRERVLPRRTPGQPARAFDVGTVFSAAGEEVVREWREKPKWLRKDPEYFELLGRAVERFERGDPSGPLDPQVEAAYAVRVGYNHISGVVDYWIATEGPAFAVDAWALMWRWDPWGHAIPVPDEETYRYAREWTHEWAALRRAVAGLDDRGYGEARLAAEKLLRRAPLAMRGLIAFAFPDEGDWSKSVLAQRLAMDHEAQWAQLGRDPGFGACLLAALHEPADLMTLVAQLIKHRTPDAGLEYAASMLDGVGLDATAPLIRLVDALRGKERRAGAEILACVESERAARALSSQLHEKNVRPVARAYLERLPELAVPALVSVVGGGGKAADGARQLLRKVATPGLLDRVASGLSGRERKVIDELRGPGPGGEGQNEAGADELPRVLHCPPWADPDHRPPKILVVKGLEPDLEGLPEPVVWDEGEREQWLAPMTYATGDDLRGWGEIPEGIEDRSDEMEALVREKVERAGDGEDYFKRLHFCASWLELLTDRVALEIWNTSPPRVLDASDYDMTRVLARA
jgi:hypothetical protein